MKFSLRPAHPSEATELSDLCLRSKAHWGYDAAFLENCREELTLSQQDCVDPRLIVADYAGRPVGVAQVGALDGDADLLLCYVDPNHLGQGLGQALFDWCVDTARKMGAARLMIDADPSAEAFYVHMGARRIGKSPSGSIPGRFLPQLEYRLK